MDIVFLGMSNVIRINTHLSEKLNMIMFYWLVCIVFKHWTLDEFYESNSKGHKDLFSEEILLILRDCFCIE